MTVPPITSAQAARTWAPPGDSGALLEAAFEAVGDGILVLEPAGRIVFANQAMVRLTGLTDAAALQAAFASRASRFQLRTPDGALVPVEDWPASRVLRGEPVHDVELLVRRLPEAEERWLDFTAHPALLPGGGRALTVLVVRDLTHQKRVEADLRRREARARALAENSRDHVAVLEVVRDAVGRPVDWRYVDANDAALAMLRRSREELVGRSVVEVLPAERVPPLFARFEEVLESGRTVRYETAFADLTLLVSLFRLDGDTVASASIDISDRRRAEEHLQSVARFPQENPDPILRISREGAVTFANDAARTLLLPLGVREGEPAPESLAAPAREALGAGAGLRREVECGAATYSMSVVPVGGDVNVYGHDVTQRRRAEEALREADRQKNAFLSVLSHELRNPLAPIQNAVQILDQVAADGEAARRAREVLRRQVGQLSRLVDDLLDVTRIAHGKVELQLERLDAREVVRRACADVKELFARRGIALRSEEPPAPAWVDADAARLAQMVGNLLQNALKFTPQGGRVEVEVRSREGRCELRVADTGIGIAPADLERIFAVFVQSERTRERSQSGLGIGLSVVRELAVRHGGEIRAASAGPGQGAEFVLSLPLAAPPERAEAQGDARPASASRTVLVVEDNEDVATTLADLLALDGHTVRTAPTGKAGVEAVAEARPDVLICDIGLPDLDGKEVIRLVREATGPGALFAIALTGYAQPSDREEALAAGFDAHLPKPPPLAELQELLARAGR